MSKKYITDSINIGEHNLDASMMSSLNTIVANSPSYLTTTGKAADSNLLDGIDSASFLRSDANDSFTGNLTTGADNHITFGPNSSWGSSLRVGGNGRTATGTEMASVVTTDGNLHLDAANSSNSIYLNFYAGTGGTKFGNGGGSIVAVMGSDGDLWKGSSDNSGSKYWHAGNLTNVSQLTNDSGYLIQGNTQNPGGWASATKFKSSGQIADADSGSHSLQVISDNGLG